MCCHQETVYSHHYTLTFPLTFISQNMKVSLQLGLYHRSSSESAIAYFWEYIYSSYSGDLEEIRSSVRPLAIPHSDTSTIGDNLRKSKKSQENLRIV